MCGILRAKWLWERAAGGGCVTQKSLTQVGLAALRWMDARCLAATSTLLWPAEGPGHPQPVTGLPQSASYCAPRANTATGMFEPAPARDRLFRERSTDIMANSHLHSGVGARFARLAAMAATLAVGRYGLLRRSIGANATGQETAGATRRHAASRTRSSRAGAQTAWVKLCEKATAQVKGKDGKDEKKDLNICLTHHERLDGNTGMVLVSAALRQIDGQDKQHFMVMVPLGMLIQPGHARHRLPEEPLGKGAEEREARKDRRGQAERPPAQAIRFAMPPAAPRRWTPRPSC